MKIHCLYDQLIPVSELKPHPKNRNSHPKDQIERLAKILEFQGWRYPIKVSKRSGFITSGHGRLEAAISIGLNEVPVNFQEYESEEQEIADLTSDNAIALWAELDMSLINMDLTDLGPDFDIDLLGIKDFVLDLNEQKDESEDTIYNTKIEIPIYQPTGEKPKLNDLYDLLKTNELILKINQSNLKEDLKNFLRIAAYRHTIFNYKNIAEYYAQSEKEIQDLFEDSALVIIDFKKAIENGFVELTKKLSELYPYDNE